MMKELFRTLRRFLPPYKWYVLGNIVFSILTPLLNLLSFSLIIPILRILFQMDKRVYTFMSWEEAGFSLDGLRALPGLLQNNFNYYVQQLIATQGASRSLLILGVYLVSVTLIKVLSQYMGLFFMIPVRTGIVRDIRNDINSKVLQLPIAFFSNERKGDIIARITGDVNEIEYSVMSSLDMLIKNPIMIIVCLIAMIAISPQLTLFVFILLPIAGYIMGLVGKRLKRDSLEGQNQWGFLISIIEETLGGLRVIKAFHAEPMMKARFERHNNLFRTTIRRVMMRQQLAHPMSEFLGTAAIAVVLWYGGSLILGQGDASGLDASTFIYYLIIFYSIINPAKELSKCLYDIRKGMASLERVDKILLAQNNLTDPAQPQPVIFENNIEYRGVSFRYNEKWVLRDVHLTIPKGKTVAIVGASGSGKSTLVDLLPRFHDVQQGQVLIDGVDIRAFRMRELRKLMGYVNQEAILFNDTVRQNISFGETDATQSQVKEAAIVANADEFVSILPEGYETNIGDRGGKLSGGQRQRISIARAILKDPEILILDEATSALDTASERIVQEALERLTEGRTTIIIAHRLSTIVGADVIVVMHEGQIVEQGTHAELLALNGRYANLVRMQSF